jgi:ethanolamine ammonia-lyase large subunit
MKLEDINTGVFISPVDGKSIPSYLKEHSSEGDAHVLYQKIVGAANPYKEGDEAVGVCAGDEESRERARCLILNTELSFFHSHPLHIDELQKYIWSVVDESAFSKIKNWTMQKLKDFLLNSPEEEIKQTMVGLNSDIIGCMVKTLTNSELCIIGKKVFNPLPESNIGGKGYLSARIQPNSPTDNPQEIIMQVFNGWAYATGDLILGIYFIFKIKN